MARKYQLTHSITLATQDDPNSSGLLVDQKVDLAVLLSQRLQRNVRQGHVFHLHKVKASLRPVVDGEYDLGVGAVGEIYHCPATKNSVRAWQHLFGVWRKQKALKVGALGPSVRYDDFEVGWNTDLHDSRTSTVLTQGMGDDTAEDVVIYGTSADGDEITLQDTWESLQEIPEPSRFPIGNATVKAAKWVNEFPIAQKTGFHAHWTSKHSDNNTPLLDWVNVASGQTGAQSESILDDTGTLAGVLRVRAWLGPVDDATTSPDEAVLSLTFTVSLGTPLVQKRITSRKKSTQSSFKKKTTGRRYRRRKGR